MKLLLYSHFFAPSVGGVETVVRLLAQGLCALRKSDGSAEFELKLITETAESNLADSTLGFPVIRRPTTSRLWREIAQADVVHLAGPALKPALFALAMRKPTVIEHHGFQTICPNGQLLIDPPGMPCPGHFRMGHHGICLRCNARQGWVGSIKLWTLTFLRRWLCQKASANITPTQWLNRQLELPKTVTIQHGLPNRNGTIATQKRARPLLAFVGRLVTTKGVKVLLEAAKQMAAQGYSFEIVVVGDGPERESLESAATQISKNGEPLIRFEGRLEQTELETILAQATAVIVPSLGGEVFGLAVLENMQRGLPVIASDLGAFTEVLGDSGLTFRTGDAQELVRSIAGLLQSPALAATIGSSAQRRAEKYFTLSKMIADHADQYRRVFARNAVVESKS